MTGPRQRLEPGVGGGAGASANVPAAMIGLAVLLGPLGVTWCIAAALDVAEQDRLHWQEVARMLAALSIATCVTVALVAGNPFAFQYGAMWHWVLHPNFHPTVVFLAFWRSGVIGTPVGALLGVCITGNAEARAVGAEWHPLDQRWHRVEERRAFKRSAAAASDRAAQSRCTAPPVGVAVDGDLSAWREGDFVVIPPELRGLGLGLVGASGSGKTETAKQLVRSAGASGRRLIFVDCKGTDTKLPEAVVASYIDGAGRDDITVQVFPDEPLNGWLGTTSQLVGRLMLTQDYTEPFYRDAADAVLRIVADGTCDSSTDFMSRLSLRYLKAAAAANERRRDDLDALRANRNVVDGTRFRFAPFFEALDGAFDGDRSFGDADVTIVSVPTLVDRRVAEATIKMLLADVMHWASDPKRKDREGEDFVLIVDEFSAVSELAASASDLSERVRDVGGTTCWTAQSYEGFGPDESTRERLLASLAGGVIVHRLVEPDRFAMLAGTVRRPEQSWQLEDTGHSGLGSMREGFRMNVSPDDVRRARVGEAWAISGGRFLHMRVIQVDVAQHLKVARRLIEASRERGRLRRAQGQQHTSPVRTPVAPSLLDDLDRSGSGDSE